MPIARDAVSMADEKDKATLPANCSACVYRAASDGLCRRHAPATAEDEFELAYWPKIRPADRCGVGAAITGNPNFSIIACETCVHWLRPGDEPVRPDYRKGLTAEWWEGSGYCTRLAPTPSSHEARRAYWRVTHTTAGCGDGTAVPLPVLGSDALAGDGLPTRS